MLRIVKSLLVIATVASLAAGATGATFTSTQTIAGMSFATGTLAITDTSAGWTKTVTFTNLKPGDHVFKWVTLTNTGSLNVEALTVTAKNLNDPSGLLGQMVVSTTGRIGSNDAATFTPAGVNHVSTWFNNADILDYSFSATPAAGVIHPGEEYTIVFDFSVPDTVGNAFQGVTASFDISFTAS